MRMLASIFKALSDETRLQMLGLLLKEGELCVCDFVEVLGVSQSKASRHLRHLVHAGLLLDRREAVWVHFRITENPGLLQRGVLTGLRGFLPAQVPAELLTALKTWRNRKTSDDRDCRPPIRERPHPQRGRR
jgi:ArsR family transcriptional regulator, arsenate/arsenite/antimonite-responsive transcriptional repressor